MKLTIDRKTFADALAEVAPFAPAKAPIAILKNAKITTKGNRMKIEANDSQKSMTKYIPLIESDADGSFLVDIADLNKFIAKTGGETIEVIAEADAVEVRHAKGSAKFSSEKVAEYPSFAMTEDGMTEITLRPDMLADAIQKGKNFVSSDTLRPQMCTIYAYIKDGEFGYCATDTHKLIHGHQTCEIPNRETDIHWFIMPHVFSAILTACKKGDSVKIQITDSHVAYRIGDNIIRCVQAKGQYPNFKRVIPQTWSMECAVDKSELAEAFGRVALFCDASECVKMDVSRMDMTLSVDNLDYMKSSKENLTHDGCDGDIKIGVNVSHAIACLGVFGNGNVLLRMDNESRPILFASGDNENMQVLAMPMQLNH